jgi:hypothetical protein
LSAAAGNAYPGACTGDGAGEGDGRAARHRLVADATLEVIADPRPASDIRRLVASASVVPNAEKAAPYRRPRGSVPHSPGCVAVDDGAAELAEEQES